MYKINESSKVATLEGKICVGGCVKDVLDGCPRSIFREGIFRFLCTGGVVETESDGDGNGEGKVGGVGEGEGEGVGDREGGDGGG